MSFFRHLRLRFAPPELTDPDFDSLLFMYIPNASERSFWECEWQFPPTRTIISIGLPGDENGPTEEARRFYLSLPDRFERIVAAVRPRLSDVWTTWLQTDLPVDIFRATKLAGFGLEDPQARPLRWDVAFETTGDKWLGITVPFIDNAPQEAIVDT